MQAIQPILLGLGMLLADGDAAKSKGPDLAHLQEMLHDRRQPLGQGQAALLLRTTGQNPRLGAGRMP